MWLSTLHKDPPLDLYTMVQILYIALVSGSCNKRICRPFLCTKTKTIVLYRATQKRTETDHDNSIHLSSIGNWVHLLKLDLAKIFFPYPSLIKFVTYQFLLEKLHLSLKAGNFTVDIYAEDCLFEDPTIQFRGMYYICIRVPPTKHLYLFSIRV